MPSVKRQATRLLNSVIQHTELYNEFAEKKKFPTISEGVLTDIK
jgi:hypothetical protein